MVVAGAGASALITALNSQKTVKSTLNLKKSIDGINKAQESGGLDNLKSITQNIMTGGPAASALAVFSANLKSKTAESSVRLLKELLELLGSDLGQAGVNALAGLINGITEKAEVLTALLNLVSDTPLEGIFGWISKINEAITDLTNPVEIVTNGIRTFTVAMNVLSDDTSTHTEKWNRLVDSLGLFGDAIRGLVDWLSNVLNLDVGGDPSVDTGYVGGGQLVEDEIYGGGF